MFNPYGLQLNRGTTTANTAGNSTIAIHTYKDTASTTAEIRAYLPPYLNQGATQDFIKLGDHMLVLGSDETIFCKITSLSPFELGIDLFTTGGVGFIVGVPTDPVDPNGLVLIGSALHAQYADDLYPGILSTTPQNISGTKSFLDDVHTNKIDTLTAVPLELGTTTATEVTIAKNNSTTVVSGITVESTVNVPANVGLQYRANGLNIINGSSEVTLDGSGFYSAPTFFVDEIQLLSPPGTLSINDQLSGVTSVSTFVFDRAAGIQFPAGSGGGQILNFKNDIAVPIVWTGPWATNSNGTINIVRINNIVILTISTVAPRVADHGAVIATTDIPSYAWPASSSTSAQVIAVSGGTSYYGSCELTSAGTLTIYTDLVGGGFSGLGLAGFYGFSLIFNLDNP